MADEHELIRAIDKATRFRDWLETEEIGDYFDTARSQLLEAIVHTKDADDIGRYRLKVAVGIVDGFRSFLEKGIADGKIAERDLEFIRSGKKRFF